MSNSKGMKSSGGKGSKKEKAYNMQMEDTII